MGKKQKLNIYCVDDDAVYLNILENELKKTEPYEISVNSFLTAGACLKQLGLKPDIIILDYYIDSNENPINGVDILKKIKKINPEINVVMLSAQDKIDVAVNSMKYGAFDYIVKNESAFARTQNVIKNIVHNIKLKKEANAYKYGSIAAVTFIITMVISVIILSSLYPRVF